MVTNYRGIAALWLAFSLLGASFPAFSGMVRSGALSLSVDSPWQRAGGDEELSADSIILRQPEPDGVLEVYLPLHRVRLKTSQAEFFEQLDQGWKLRYSDGIDLQWLDIGGVRWQVCRRSSLASNSVIFQMVTVRGDEAYQVVAVAPSGARSLPAPVQVLLQHGSWGESAPVRAAAPDRPILAAPVLAMPAQVAPAPLERPAQGKPWHLLRQVVVQPGAGQWDQIARAEKAHLGANVLVTGLGLKAKADGMDWFLDGTAAAGDEAGLAGQKTFGAHWQLNWSLPAGIWREGESQTMALTFNDALETAQAGNGFGVRYELVGICAPASALVSWLNELGKGRMEAMNRIGVLIAGCRPQPDPPSPVTVMAAMEANAGIPGQPINRQVTLPLPTTWAAAIQAREPDSVRRFLLIMHFMASGPGTAPGDALLKQTAVIYEFGPDS